ncbi:discoidin domain-containing protein [Microbulbifer sp. CAU 1566]|uniref:di-heme oxidoredictase family protein n=1 Tax=Microbulbifer sp. CAU 1566 TaxID=2933269 RepID=UPI002003A3AF|nr:di-heme oxidoredictase family protein [Microbulbifer sp. CAU 1566]MCK7597745.1 discoidin domain-containing protein [Microbulbifer sp. CAU 1566]
MRKIKTTRHLQGALAGRLVAVASLCSIFSWPVLAAEILTLNKPASATSEIQSASLAFDGNQNTRWESAHQVDPSSLTVDLADTFQLESATIYWEAANASDYIIEGSANGVNWNQIASFTGGAFGNRTDVLPLTGNYRYVRMNALQRSAENAWGYSIWEMEVEGTAIVEVPADDNIALLGSASASSGDASQAIDGNGGTRWESDHAVDPSWIAVDLGDSYPLSQVVLDWEAANAKRYEVQGSLDGANWDTLQTFSGGEFGSRTDALAVSGNYRYVRMYGAERSDGNDWGYSIWEFQVFARAGDIDPPPEVDLPSNLPPPDFSNLTYNTLYDTVYTPESSQEWRVEADGTIVTLASGRARSRHESEDIFYTFPTHYFEHRTFEIEIHDHTPAGENLVEIFYHPEYANYVPPGCRSSYSNEWRADFNNNAGMDEKLQQAAADGTGERWVCRIQRDAHNGDDGVMRVGEWMEFELQQFLGRFEGDPNVRGQAVYYTDTYRIKLGQPGLFIVNDEVLDAQLRSGGRASAPYVRAGDAVPAAEIISVNADNTVTYKVASNGKWTQKANPSGELVTFPILDGIDVYDNYVVDSGVADWTTYMREGLNTQWDTHNVFMQGRRVFHTRFDSGVHEEAGNPDFPELANLADGLLVKNSCFGCHINNGRGIAPQNNQPLDTLVTKIGNGYFDELGKPEAHSYFGSALQGTSLNSAIPAEANVVVNYSTKSGTFNDGAAYTLQEPHYTVVASDAAGGAAPFISPRMPQSITGLGLLEAVPESEILAWKDPDDANGDGISGRANVVDSPSAGERQIGRFGWKATSSSLLDFTAEALSADIGVTTSVLPSPACGAEQTACQQNSGQGVELSDLRLQEMVVYLQALGAPSRRPDEVNQPAVIAGQQHFSNLGCVACHRPSMDTGYRHDLPELRGNTIRPYTDLLLHDMGEELADSLTASPALNREWRTPPLWGLGMLEAVSGHTSLLHDGRARSIEEAILWHGGEAANSQAGYRALAAGQRAELIAFLRSL